MQKEAVVPLWTRASVVEVFTRSQGLFQFFVLVGLDFSMREATLITIVAVPLEVVKAAGPRHSMQ
jgi:hypothetical protein